MSPRGRPSRKARPRMGRGPGTGHRLPALRGRRRAGHRGARPDRSVDRRLRAVRRRDRRLAVLDACVRLLPGVMGREESGAEESSKTACSNIPTIPARANGKGAPFPRCCSRATMPRSPPGGEPRRKGSRGNDGPICRRFRGGPIRRLGVCSRRPPEFSLEPRWRRKPHFWRPDAGNG